MALPVSTLLDLEEEPVVLSSIDAWATVSGLVRGQLDLEGRTGGLEGAQVLTVVEVPQLVGGALKLEGAPERGRPRLQELAVQGYGVVVLAGLGRVAKLLWSDKKCPFVQNPLRRWDQRAGWQRQQLGGPAVSRNRHHDEQGHSDLSNSCQFHRQRTPEPQRHGFARATGTESPPSFQGSPAPSQLLVSHSAELRMAVHPSGQKLFSSVGFLALPEQAVEVACDGAVQVGVPAEVVQPQELVEELHFSVVSLQHAFRDGLVLEEGRTLVVAGQGSVQVFSQSLSRACR